MPDNINPNLFIVIAIVGLTSCGKKEKSVQRPPEVMFANTVTGSYLDTNQSYTHELIGFCKRMLETGWQQEFGVYRDTVNKNHAEIQIQEVMYTLSDSGYSTSVKQMDTARTLRLVEGDGSVDIVTTPESRGSAAPSKLDLKPENYGLLTLPNRLNAPVNSRLVLKGYLDQDVECKRVQL